MVSVEDFIVKGRGERIDFNKLYMDKIQVGQKRTMRILEEPSSDMVKKFIPTHQYIKGLGNTVCNNSQENFDAGKPCKFCIEFVKLINEVEKEQFDWLKTLSVVNLEETDKFNNEISKAVSSDSLPKIIFNNGKVFELGKTFEKDVSSQLNEEEKKIYNGLYVKRNKLMGKLRASKFMIPVFDYASDEAKIFEFKAAIWNKLDEVFTKAGYNFTSADITITNNGQLGNYWLASKKDSEPVAPKVIASYDKEKEAIKRELERRTAVPTPEEQEKLFERYKTALAKAEGTYVEETTEEAAPTPTKNEAQSKDDLKDLF